jgi:hypothetical protein
LDDDLEANLHDEVYVSKNGQCQWRTSPPEHRGRRSRHDILKQLGGPAPHVMPTSMSESIAYFLTDDMLDEICHCTNLEAEQQAQQDTWFPLCKEEFRAFIGILFLMGALRGGYQSLADFWSTDFGQNAIIAKCQSTI